jgi:TctA family transporter
MAKGKKMNIKNVLINAGIIGGTGALSTIIATLVEGDMDTKTNRPKNAEIVDYGMIAAGIVLPEIVKNTMVESASDALLAVGAYRMATAYGLPGKLGINGIAPGSNAIGTWNPARTIKAQKVQGQPKNGNSKTII